MARKMCKQCGNAQAVRPGGLCNRCFGQGANVQPKNVQTIPLAKVRLDGGTQRRKNGTEAAHVRDLAADQKAGAALPPIQVCFDGKWYWPWDGNHTAQAGLANGLTEIQAVVREGGRRDAQFLSCRANTGHKALKRTQEDKESAVRFLLADEEWGQLSVNAIAEACGVSWGFANDIVQEVRGRGDGKVVCADKHGNTITMDTSRIRKPKDEAGPEQEEGWEADLRSSRPQREEFTSHAGSDDGPDMAGLAQEHMDEWRAEDEARGEKAGGGLGPDGGEAAAPSGSPAGPEDACREALQMFEEAEAMFKSLERHVNRLAQLPGGELYRRELKLERRGGVDRFHCPDLANARKTLQHFRPHKFACPYCKGEQEGLCNACHGLPYVTREVWDRAPQELKDACQG